MTCQTMVFEQFSRIMCQKHFFMVPGVRLSPSAIVIRLPKQHSGRARVSRFWTQPTFWTHSSSS